MSFRGALKLFVILAFAACVLLGLAIPLFPANGFALERFSLSAFVLAVHAAIGVGLSEARARGKIPRVMAAGFVVAACGALVWLAYIWAGVATLASRDLATQLASVLSAESAVLAVIGVQLAQPASRGVARLVRWGTVVTAVGLLVLVPVVVWTVGLDAVFYRPPLPVRIATGLVIITAAGMCATLVMARLADLDEAPPPPDTPVISVLCPRCGGRGPIRLNGDVCGHCNLRIKVQVP